MGCFEKLNLFFLRGLFHPILPRFFTYAPGTVTKGKGCRDLTSPGGWKTKKAPTVSGERDVLDEVDIAFYNGFKELTDEQKETIRDMVQLMRARRSGKESNS